jgi:signal recognition particle subunit SRP54
MIRQFMGGKSGGGGMPDPATMSPDQMSELARGMGQGLGGMPPMGGLPRGVTLPAGLSGLMRKK